MSSVTGLALVATLNWFFAFLLLRESSKQWIGVYEGASGTCFLAWFGSSKRVEQICFSLQKLS